ncbi:MAG: hypothetical protein U0X20_10300 [Caldilineaceae bacterium]
MTNNESTIKDASSAGPAHPQAKSPRLTLLVAIPVLVLALVAGIWLYQNWATNNAVSNAAGTDDAAALVVAVAGSAADAAAGTTANSAADSAASAEQRTAATTISVKTLEERYGIRLRLLAVTALGGMVDLRYMIMDHTKATALAQYLGQIELVDDDSGTTLKMATGHGMHRNDRIEDGQLNFHFFANARNAIKQGSPVTVVIGPVRLEAINAQ